MKKLSKEAMAEVVGGKMFGWERTSTPCVDGVSHTTCKLTLFWIPISWSGDFPC